MIRLSTRYKLLLSILTVTGYALVRNTSYLLSTDSLTLPEYSDREEIGHPAEVEKVKPRQVEEVIRLFTTSAASAVAERVEENLRKNLPFEHVVTDLVVPTSRTTMLVVVNGTGIKLPKDKNETEHTMLKANMSHIRAIVKGFNSTKRRDEPVKFAKPHPFQYVINSPNICGKDNVFMLIYIHTAPDHHKRRTVIRQTWGKIEQYTDVIVRMVFVMGVNTLDNYNKTDVQKAVFFESEQYGDIVQEDFLDTYHNLTHKGVTALKWITYHCSQATFVLKTDDDIFVNTYTLLRHLKKMKRENRIHDKLMCAVWYQMTVIREGKWKVTVEEWPESIYPTYCSGSAFILSMDVVITLYHVSYHVPFFWVDDFYITGLLPLKAGNVSHTDFGSTFVLNGDLLEEKFTGSQWYMYVFSHVHNLNRIQAVWDTMTKMARGELPIVIKTALPGDLENKDSYDRKLGVF